METKKSKAQNQSATKPWGQKILREKALEVFKSGKVVPSTLMGNLLAASASEILDTDMLLAAPRAMSPEANRVVSQALQRSRLPNEDLKLIFDELIELTWVPKKTSAQAEAQKASAVGNAPASRKGAGKEGKAPTRKSMPIGGGQKTEPIIVRRQSKLSPKT